MHRQARPMLSSCAVCAVNAKVKQKNNADTCKAKLFSLFCIAQKGRMPRYPHLAQQLTYKTTFDITAQLVLHNNRLIQLAVSTSSMTHQNKHADCTAQLGSGKYECTEIYVYAEVCRERERERLFVGCIMSQQHESVSQGRICSDNFTCCHTEIEVAD